ncbi:amidase [Ancylobacter amanitiformis]|uniref:Amidase n=1 Tax=Ancylobacter amanitiformis TaxID=217069 RepID=A0ABU0LT05_9HYPH|nr:amidase [Ancylobacter amanitiformis]MDQ0511838.1 amidase [Ancylobacter amanitiformis]
MSNTASFSEGAGPADLSARETAALVAAGTLSAEAVSAAFMERIALREPDVQAFAHFDRDRVLAEARTNRGGELAGVTFGVKDVIDTADMPTGYGSAAYEGSRPPWDAPIVALTRRFGGVVMGKTVSTEFAMSSPGKTRNPHNPAHTPGGSSSGSCAAVAAGMVQVAFGTQTAGSILRPASYCGVVGYKPSFGTLNRAGMKPLSDSLDHLGLITRDVRDAAFAVAALAEKPALAEGMAGPGLRVGLFRTSRWEQAEPATRAALVRTAAAIEAAGGTVRELDVPESFESYFALFDAVMGWETPRTLAYERDSLGARLSPLTLGFIATLARATRDDYDAALAVLKHREARVEELLEGCDVLITPAAPGEAPAGLGATGDPVFNKVWTLLHVPALSVPAGLGPSGLPVGVQVVGRIGDDVGTLAAAAFIEDALKAQAS